MYHVQNCEDGGGFIIRDEQGRTYPGLRALHRDHADDLCGALNDAWARRHARSEPETFGEPAIIGETA